MNLDMAAVRASERYGKSNLLVSRRHEKLAARHENEAERGDHHIDDDEPGLAISGRTVMVGYGGSPPVRRSHTSCVNLGSRVDGGQSPHARC